MIIIKKKRHCKVRVDYIGIDYIKNARVQKKICKMRVVVNNV